MKGHLTLLLLNDAFTVTLNKIREAQAMIVGAVPFVLIAMFWLKRFTERKIERTNWEKANH